MLWVDLLWANFLASSHRKSRSDEVVLVQASYEFLRVYGRAEGKKHRARFVGPIWRSNMQLARHCYTGKYDYRNGRFRFVYVTISKVFSQIQP